MFTAFNIPIYFVSAVVKKYRPSIAIDGLVANQVQQVANTHNVTINKLLRINDAISYMRFCGRINHVITIIQMLKILYIIFDERKVRVSFEAL